MAREKNRRAMIKYINDMDDFEYYEANEYKVQRTLFGGVEQDIRQCRYQIPQLIVNSWNSILLAEKPTIEIKGLSNDKLVEDVLDLGINTINTYKMAYGKVYVIPQIINGSLCTKVLNDKEKTNAIEVNGQLTFLEYNQENHKILDDNTVEKYIERHIHKYDFQTRIYQYEIYVDDVNKRDEKYHNVDSMAPFVVYNSNLSHIGKAIFHDAKHFINRVDDDINRIAWESEVTEPVILLPGNMLKKVVKKVEVPKDPRNGEKKKTKFEIDNTRDTNSEQYRKEFIASGDRQFRKIDNKNGDEKMLPTLWNPALQVEELLKLTNQDLHMVSLLCGFGAKYFSYDTESGFKTATQVVSDKDVLYKMKCILDQDIEYIYKALINGFRILIAMPEIPFKDIIMTFSDAIITDDAAKRKQYFDDYQTGAIDQFTYLKLVGYTTDEIEEVRKTLPDDILEDKTDMKGK